MADTCYGKSDNQSSAPSMPVPGEGADAAMSSVAPIGLPSPPAAEQASVHRHPDGHATALVPVEPVPEDSAMAYSSESTAEPAAEPRLALEQMNPVVDDGILMVFGPEGDPVPPRAFADAALSRPDLKLTLPDGAAVPVERIAAVLEAQAGGSLVAAEQGDAWILTMLGRGEGPELAAEEVLQAERDHDFAGQAAGSTQSDADPGGHRPRGPEADFSVRPGEGSGTDVTPLAETDAASQPCVNSGPDAGSQPCVASHQVSPDETSRDAIVGTNQDVLPHVELDLDGWVGMAEPQLDLELDLDFPTESLDFDRERRDEKRDDPSAMTDRTGGPADGHSVPGQVPEVAAVGDDGTLVVSDWTGSAADGHVAPDQVPEAAPAGDDAALAVSDWTGGPAHGHTAPDQLPEAASPIDDDASLAVTDWSGDPADGPAVSDEAPPEAGSQFGNDASLAMTTGDRVAGHAVPDPVVEAAQPVGDDASMVVTDWPGGPADGHAIPDEAPEAGSPLGDDVAPAMVTGDPFAGHAEPDQVPEATLSEPRGSVDPFDHVDQPGGAGTVDLNEEDGVRDQAPAGPYLNDGIDGAGEVTAVENRTSPKVEPAQRLDIDRREVVQERESGPAGIGAVPTVSDQADVDPENIALVVIRGVPEGAMLSTGTRDEDGSWSISPLDLSSVMISMVSDDASHGAGVKPPMVEGDLDITGIGFTEQGELVTISETVPLSDYVAEAPTTHPGPIEPDQPVVAPKPRMIPLNIDPRAWADESFDALVVRDLPLGARLSAGSYDPSIDGWVLMPQDLPTLAIAPPSGLGSDFILTLMGVALRPGNGNAARVLARLPVNLA